VTYEVDFFCGSNGLDLPAVATRFKESVAARDVKILIEDVEYAGSLWTFDVGGGMEHEPIVAVVRHGHVAVRAQIEHVGARHNAPDLSSVDMTVQLLLGDNINPAALTLVWAILVEEFSGIPYDEMDGFEASL
jgi:hypothetical protein